MKQSIYNLKTNCNNSNDVILFNTLYGSTAIIKSNNLSAVLNILEYPDIQHTQEENEFLNSLIMGKFIIEDSIDEIEIVKKRKLAGMEDNNRLDLIIMPTLDCNFACPYCYEPHIPNTKMHTKVEKAVEKWLTNEIPRHKVVVLNWFGGEPLLNYSTLGYLSRFLSKQCKMHGIELLPSITTNGYNLTREMIKKLTSLEIYNYQITVDGPQKIHDKTRILKNGNGSFHTIYQNIINLCMSNNQVKISLRVNYNHNNIEFIPELLNTFPEGIRKQLRIVFEPIFGSYKLSATKNMPSQEISALINKYYKKAKELGYNIVLGTLGIGKLVYCYAERKNQYIINYTGEVFKCSVCTFKPENRIGFINDDGELKYDKNNWNQWFKIDLFEERCKGCIYLPLCMGGCRKDRIENKSTGSYCSLIPNNTSYALKNIAFDDYCELLRNQVETANDCR